MKLNYLPLPVALAYKGKEVSQKFDASALSLDLVGFTAMCESLLKLGRKGEETLASELETIFAPMVRAIDSHGGYVAEYAGDALLALFPVEGGLSAGNAIYLASSAAKECLDWLAKSGVRRMPAGEFNITARVGIAFGKAEFRIIEYTPSKDSAGTSRLGYCFFGEAIEKGILAQANAESGKINTFPNAPSPEICVIPETVDYPSLSPSDLKRFLPDVIVDQQPRGEARRIACAFGRFSQELGSDARERTFALISEGEAGFGGYFSELQYDAKGWGFLVIFGAPEAYEDYIPRAIEFALFIQQKLSETGINVRFGINAGEVYAGLTGGAGRVKYACLGDVINLAERLSEIAEERQIICSDSMMSCAWRFEFKELGSKKIRGRKNAVNINGLVGHKGNVAGVIYEGNFCGRERELAVLKEMILPIFDKMFGGVLRVIGAGGSGKSRIVYEFLKMLMKEGKNFRWVYLSCDPIGRNPLNALIHMLKSRFPFTEFGDRDKWKHRFRWALEEFARNPKISDENRNEILRTISILGGYIGYRWEDSLYETLDAKGKKENFLFAMKSFVKANADIAPTIVEIEDAHWLDAETESWLEILTRNVADVPFIIITTERPGEAGTVKELKFGNDVHEQLFMLENLNDDGLRELATIELGAPPDTKLFDYLRHRTEGNPFFTEQFCKHFLDQKAVQLRNDRMCLISPPELLPPDAETMLVARIDSMGVRLKDMLQKASVLGVRFAIRILERMMESDEKIITLLDRAVQKGAILADEIVKLTELYYTFRHALLREAAYGMQLPGVRAELHKIALELYEQLYTEDQRKPHYADMSRHAEIADEKEKFVEYLKKSADYAKETYNNGQAIDLYDRLAQVQQGILEKETAALEKIKLLVYSGRTREAIETATDCKERLEKMKEPPQRLLCDCIGQLGSVYTVTGHPGDGIEYHQKQLSLAIKMDDKEREMQARGGLAEASFSMSSYEDALKHYKDALGIGRILDDKINIIKLLGNMGNCHAYIGNYQEARECLKESIVLSKEIRNIQMEGWYSGRMAVIFDRHCNPGEEFMAAQCTKKCLEIGMQVGDKRAVAIALGNLGNEYRKPGCVIKSIELLKKGLDVALEIGDLRIAGRHCQNICMSYHHFGDFEMVRKYNSMALAYSKEAGDKHSLAWEMQGTAYLFELQGEFEKALECRLQSDEILKSCGEKYNRCLNLYGIAWVYFELGKYEDAYNITLQHEQLSKEVFGKRIWNSNIMFAMIEYKIGNKKKALTEFREVIKEIRKEKHWNIGWEGTIRHKIWKATKRNEDAEEALKLLRTGYDEYPYYSLKQCINEILGLPMPPPVSFEEYQEFENKKMVEFEKKLAETPDKLV